MNVCGRRARKVMVWRALENGGRALVREHRNVVVYEQAGIRSIVSDEGRVVDCIEGHILADNTAGWWEIDWDEPPAA